MQFSRHLIEQTEHVLADARIYQREFPRAGAIYLLKISSRSRARARAHARARGR